MISYRAEIEIHKPLEEVIRLFSDRDQLSAWQPGLLSSELLESDPIPTYKLIFQFGRRTMTMTERILRNELPQHFDVHYKMKGVHNHMQNSFMASGSKSTHWVCESEFKFKGLMKIISLFMKDNFQKQSDIIMSNFKRYAESR
jgi:hypothetical protein